MNKLLTEWRNYTKSLIKEGNAADYFENVNKLQTYINNNKDWGTIQNYEILRNAAKDIISNDNAKYWRHAGQTGTPNQVKKADPNSVWSVALEMASKDARGAETEPVGTKMQRNIKEQFHIRIPFLDSSSGGDIDPYWRKRPVVGALLQTASNMFLELDGVLYMLLIILTGGLGAVPGKVGTLFNNIHKIMNLQSSSPKAKSAIQEVESFARNTINKFVNSPYKNKIILDDKTKVLKFQDVLDYLLSQSLGSAESTYVTNLRNEVIAGIEKIIAKYGF